MIDRVAWAAALAVLGAIIGSFVATLVLRWSAGRSVIRGRSACDSCGAAIRPRDLVPLVSAVVLRGRCRDCGARIDPWHWWIEAVAAWIGAAAGSVAVGPLALGGAVFGWLLLALAALDLRRFWLPDRLTGLVAMCGVVGGLAGLAPSLADRVIGGVAGFGALWLIARGYKAVRGRDGMGGGDPKLLGAIGLWLGWRMLPAVLIVACLAGLGVVLVAMLTRRSVARDTPLPLGTLIAAAAYPAWLLMIGLMP